MAVALNHLQRLVSHYLGDFSERRAGHGEIAGSAMPQIMEPKILDASIFYGILP
jgi:hypothetical protein